MNDSLRRTAARHTSRHRLPACGRISSREVRSGTSRRRGAAPVGSEQPGTKQARSAAPIDVAAVIRQRGYIGLLALAAVIGVVVSLASWCFLEIVHLLQQWVYTD